ncbi:hypothetical protein ACGFZG_25030 [Streptomyces antibioticus]|uniref:hypothetical protein n=1 Tax=Streptomyces TaxID=1883 RepID=UPI00158735E0|nr:hypothetical protein [Streptomyces sp. CAI-85]NUV60651.1 hypothetical protein [Streptomyces sp. CAI-85]
MTTAMSYTERALFLAAVKDLGEGDEIMAATYDLFVDMAASTPAPWADTDPHAAELYLVSRGTDPAVAAAGAAEFEVNFRAIVAMGTGEPVHDFRQIADWIAEHVDARQ